MSEAAAKYGATVDEETSKPDEAYARFGPEERDGVPPGVAAVLKDPDAPADRRREPGSGFTLTSDTGDEISLESLRGKQCPFSTSSSG